MGTTIRERALDRRTVASLLLDAAHRWPQSASHYAVAGDVRDVVVQTYPALLDVASRLLGGLRAQGLRPGQRLALVAEQPQDFVQGVWACVLGGYVPCPLTPLRGDPGRWARHVADVNELIGSSAMLTTTSLQAELPEIDGVTTLSLDALSAAAGDATFHDSRPEDLALLMLTSGSTGNAKAVRLTHGNLIASMTAKAQLLDVTDRDTTMNWVSLDHIAGVESHLLPLSAGANQVQVEPQTIMADPTAFLQAVDAHRVTTTFTPNFLFGQINKALSQDAAGLSVDLSPLRIIISGGEATVSATTQAFLDRLAPYGLARGVVHPAFGMTETCAGSIFNRDFPDVEAGLEFASVGQPVRGLEMRVVDDDDAVLPEGDVGELQVRGPVVFEGYDNNDAATKEAFADGDWFRTGDRGAVSGGRLTLAGRSKDSIIVNGVSYYSHDLEAVLEQLDDVDRSYAAAFPTRPPGSDTEQLVVTFVPTIPPDDEAGIHRLIMAVRNSVILHWGFRPATILPLPRSEVPKTSLGKVQRSLLRKRHEAGRLGAYESWVRELTARQLGGYVEPEGETERALAEIYAEMFGMEPGAISATASFFDLGGTSLEILQLKHKAQARFGIADIPVITVLRSPTVRALAARLGEGGVAGSYDPLVPLQTSGDKTPLFCVHPGVGEVLVFVNLAKYFVNERPFYGLRARGFGEGEDYFGSFDEMVRTYVDAIRAEQPAGPYAIAGYSYGGVVAFEIAKSLEALGERVDFVGIFNLPPHIKGRMHELDFAEGAVNLAFFLSLVSKEQAAELPDQLRDGMTEDEQLAYLIEIARPQRLAELDLDLPKFAGWVRLAQSLVGLGRTYEPSGDVKSLSIFYAIPLRGTKDDWLNHDLRQWDNFTREPNTYIDVPGEHYTLMGPDHVAAFQGFLRAELDRALGGK